MPEAPEREWLTLWEAAGLLGMRSGYVRLLTIGRRIDFVRILTDERVAVRVRCSNLLTAAEELKSSKAG